MVEDYAILRDLPSVTNYARQCVSCIRLNIAHPSIVAVCADNFGLDGNCGRLPRPYGAFFRIAMAKTVVA